MPFLAVLLFSLFNFTLGLGQGLGPGLELG